MLMFLICLAVICYGFWYLRLWPFDGKTGLPQREGDQFFPKMRR